MWRQIALAFIPLAILIAIPILLRPSGKAAGAGLSASGDRLVIVTPHSESIKYEFGRAFRDYYRRKFGREISIEWRSPGGTSDIVRFIADRYESAFRQYWTSKPENAPWDKVVAANFNNSRAIPGSGLPDVAIQARQQFLASDTGIGIDLFFGGGQFDHHRHAEKGYAVDAGIQRLHPEWFNDAVIPQRFSGEIFYDPAGRYYGTCLASFGICWNIQRLEDMTDRTLPTGWTSLGEPRFLRQIAVADPTKSGSVNKCFEMMIQQQMALAMAADPKDGLSTGWVNGLNLIKRIAANCRYITDSASKVPHDTATGMAAAGICIDFYGRTEAEWSAVQNHGISRMVFLGPPGGTSVTADPIQLLRGAPNREAAVAFIEFLLSVDGQKLWNFRKDTPGGPLQYALRRMPIRKDLYTPECRLYMSDPEPAADPYLSCAGFVYHPEWTGKYFSLLRILIKCIALDVQEDAQVAWREIIRAGGASKVPQAMAEFNAVPFPYADAEKARTMLLPEKNSTLEILRTQRSWSEFARQHYIRAAQLARERK